MRNLSVCLNMWKEVVIKKICSSTNLVDFAPVISSGDTFVVSIYIEECQVEVSICSMLGRLLIKLSLFSSNMKTIIQVFSATLYLFFVRKI